MNAIKRFLKDEDGAVAIEYALLAMLIALAIVAGATALGHNICGLFNQIAGALSSGNFATLPAFAACT